MKKMSPKRRPQNAPPSAPAPARLFSCRVFGFFFPSGHVTIAASWLLISSYFWSLSRVSST
jgi:membrane-associated phospholipid phosphatase